MRDLVATAAADCSQRSAGDERMPDTDSDTVRTSGDANSSRRSSVVPVRPHLFVVMECDRPLAGGARIELTDLDEVVIGRGRVRNVTWRLEGDRRSLNVHLPSRTLSSVHARIIRHGATWVIEDAGSTNGTRVNGHVVDRAMLADSDCIEVGHTLLRLRSAVPTSATVPRLYDSQTASWESAGLVTLLPHLADRYADLARIACSNLPIVLSGKTGTGKEVTARAIHKLSGRTGPFVAINCGALVPGLVESQLFGHVKGAFSGAVRDEVGLIRSADRGTLLLDEIGDLPMSAQVALLRVLQESEVIPVGAARAIPMDVRFIAATQNSLLQLVTAGQFRDDLRSRLEGHVMELLALKERREDLGILIGGLLSKLSPAPPVLRPSVAQMLMRYDWPLNIRELEHVLSRAMTLAGGGAIAWRHLPESIVNGTSACSDSRDEVTAVPERDAPAALLSEADQQLRARLVASFELHRGNLSEVARETGKARMQIQRWIRRLAIDPNEFRGRE